MQEASFRLPAIALALVMFVGEAPGYYEDLKGRPFVGAAGRVLDRLLEEMGRRRRVVYIGNVVKCRPPGNRDPREEEIEACSPYLDEQISVIRPRILVTLGRHSTKYVFSRIGRKISGITSVRGKPVEGRISGVDLTVFPTYHPAAALYNPGLREVLVRDFEALRKLLEVVRGKGDKGGGLLTYM